MAGFLQGKQFRWALLLLGVGVFVFLLLHLDIHLVVRQLVKVGWVFLIAFFAYVLSLVFSSWSWALVIDSTRSRARFRDVFAAFWAGHALNAITPTGTIGEALKGSMLANKVDRHELIGSIVISNFLSAAGTLGLLIFGATLSVFTLSLPPALLGVMLAGIGVTCLGLGVLYVILRKGFTSAAFRLVSKVPFVRFKNGEGLQEQALSIDAYVRDFRRVHPRAFWGSVAAISGARVCQALEVWAVMIPLLPHRNPHELFFIAVLTQTVSQLITWGTAFIPGQVGTAEGGSALLFASMGMDPVTGFSIEIVRRARKVIGIAIGLVLGARSGTGRLQGISTS